MDPDEDIVPPCRGCSEYRVLVDKLRAELAAWKAERQRRNEQLASGDDCCDCCGQPKDRD